MLKIGWNDGHTIEGVGTGAVGIIKEVDRDRAIGARAREILLKEYEGVEIVNCTINKSNNDMTEAVKKANDAGCNVFISNHANIGGGIGFEGFYSRYASSADIEKGKLIYNRLVATKSCLKDRRYCSDYSYFEYDLYVLKNTTMPAFLFEIGFIDNQKCVNAVNNEEVARAYAEGIAIAYNLKKKAPEVEMHRNIVVYNDGAEADRWCAEYFNMVLNNAGEDCKCVSYSEYSKGKIEGRSRFAVGGSLEGKFRYHKIFKGANRNETAYLIKKHLNRY